MTLNAPKPARPEFYQGQRDFLVLSNWLFSVDIFLSATAIPEQMYSTFIATLLKGEALLWFRATYGSSDLATVSWDMLKAAIRQYFAPPNENRRLQDEWANLRQTGTVNAYVSYIIALAMQIPDISETQVLDKFIRGLKPKTRIEVELRDPQTPQEAYRLADRFDRIVYGNNAPSFLSQQFGTSQRHYSNGSEPMQIDAMRMKRNSNNGPAWVVDRSVPL
jgi:hypothetical protein